MVNGNNYIIVISDQVCRMQTVKIMVRMLKISYLLSHFCVLKFKNKILFKPKPNYHFSQFSQLQTEIIVPLYTSKIKIASWPNITTIHS